MSTIRIGISGWIYPGWRGVFYPRGLPQRRELEYASRQVDSIEINGSFYALKRPEDYRHWYDETPEGFVFAVKGSRFITHMKKLRDVDTALANFFASGVLRLADKLGPILWQFPPNLGFDEPRFERFIRILPRDTRDAAKLGKKHDHRVSGRSWTRVIHNGPIRHAFEIRQQSFVTPRFVRLLRKHSIALVAADAAGIWPYFEDVTADFVYVRLHGATELYASGYSDPELDRWARRIVAWSSGSEVTDAVKISPLRPRRARSRDVYVYFDNDAKVHAPFDAIRLDEKIRNAVNATLVSVPGLPLT